MADAPSSRNIPLAIQREVRQRCGFGCVICGLPLFDYDHLLGWANVHRHRADEITLLCDMHHREKGAGFLTSEAVEAANRDPHNLRTGVSKPYDLHYSGSECEIAIGGNTFSARDMGYGTVLIPVSIDQTALIGFILGDGHLLLTLNLFDEYNDLILRIRNNHLFYSVSPWDIRLVGRNLVIREAERRILVDMTFEPPNRIIINRGRLLHNGVQILIHPDRVVIANDGGKLSRNVFRNAPVGIVIGPHEGPPVGMIRLPRVNRYVYESLSVNEWITREFDAPEAPA